MSASCSRKVGRRAEDTDLSLSLAAANTDLNGNGLQEQALSRNGTTSSVYTKPDNTQNRSLLLNLALNAGPVSAMVVVGQRSYYRRIKTATTNADVNDDSLDQNVYQPNAAEQAAPTAAGYSGFPTAGENAGNTPFPKWRCIANALLQS